MTIFLLSGFHRVAAERGDGLRPELLQALTPEPTATSNVIQFDEAQRRIFARRILQQETHYVR